MGKILDDKKDKDIADHPNEESKLNVVSSVSDKEPASDQKKFKRKKRRITFIHLFWYQIFRTLSWFILLVVARIRFYGWRKVPKEGPVLLVANHQSFFDPPAVGAGVYRRLNYLARKTLFKFKPFGWLIDSLDAIPLDQEGIGYAGIKESLKRLKNGEAVVIFPEGARSEDGNLAYFQPGYITLAFRSHAAIVPVAISGAFEVYSRWMKYPSFFQRPMIVDYAEPLRYEDYQSLTEVEVQKMVEDRITEMFNKRMLKRLKNRKGVFKMKAGTLNIEIHKTRSELGVAAGKAAAEAIRKAIAERGEARVIFAAAPSQNETLADLIQEEGIDWSKVTAFHMDEYIGLPEDSSARFSCYLKEHCFDKLPFRRVYLLDDPNQRMKIDDLCLRYKLLLNEAPIDVVCMGIGENGHIAFNDPPVADFNDPKVVKIVELDEVCRQQQVNDGCFPSLDAVPKKAISLTIPMLMSGKCLICSVPGERKSNAVYRTVNEEMTTACPATILKSHPNATLYIDSDSAKKL